MLSGLTVCPSELDIALTSDWSQSHSRPTPGITATQDNHTLFIQVGFVVGVFCFFKTSVTHLEEAIVSRPHVPALDGQITPNTAKPFRSSCRSSCRSACRSTHVSHSCWWTEFKTRLGFFRCRLFSAQETCRITSEEMNYTVRPRVAVMWL